MCDQELVVVGGEGSINGSHSFFSMRVLSDPIGLPQPSPASQRRIAMMYVWLYVACVICVLWEVYNAPVLEWHD